MSCHVPTDNIEKLAEEGKAGFSPTTTFSSATLKEDEDAAIQAEIDKQFPSDMTVAAAPPGIDLSLFRYLNSGN
jgi:hypothetical protein